MMEIKEITKRDQDFLFEMLYESIYTAPDIPRPSRDIIERPEISKYVENWGKPGDFGLIAVNDGNEKIGAVWMRYLTGPMKGYGYINDTIPEIGIAVDKEHRGKGVGTALLRELLERTGPEVQSVSLSVQASNPAKKLYERLGFRVCSTSGNSVIMRFDRPA